MDINRNRLGNLQRILSQNLKKFKKICRQMKCRQILSFTNMAVAVQLIPVTGQPLPLVSTGGTSIWITFLAMGILLSVSKNNINYNTVELDGQ